MIRRMNHPLLQLSLLAPLLVAGCVNVDQTTPAPVPAAPMKPPARALPVMRTETLGVSVENRPILLHRFGDGPVGTLIIGGVHGDESAAIYIAERLIELLQRGEITGLTESVAIIPLANPDGAAAGRRTNARGIDINRNFPATNWASTKPGKYHGGAAAGSEPETIALKKAVETLRPRRIVSVHSITRGRECNNYDGPGKQLAERMSACNGYPVTGSIGYPTPGSFGSWAGIDQGIPVITLELPRELSGPKAWEGNRQALIASLRDRVARDERQPVTSDNP
jgi:protein MpaA